MDTKIFVNLPVRDLPKAKSFFGKLGFNFNAQFTDETAACMIISEHAYVMLLTHEKFKAFAPNPIGDATKNTEVLVAISCENRGKVDDLVARAIAAGGKTYNKPEGLWVHVRARISGPRRSRLGSVLYGPKRYQAGFLTTQPIRE